ncbi:MAG: 1-deoxy-D-xylulose-5-phosphate reductoisomerase [SAR202 cluster bacterium Io17-Chloro-G3]|nr:MAG: 1-deoxy-D-xylulose-5-phosphate reductoisomerase [SAR202 cluster bacterium Io17-Chloro-G3]
MGDVVKRITVLGSTGSIGRQTLHIVRSFPEEFNVVGLAGWSNVELLREQVQEFRPKYVWCQGSGAKDVASELPGCSVATMEEMACHQDVDLVMVATTGKAGLTPIIAALRASKTVALANKEAVVMAGELITQEASPGQLLPVDSEPSAIWQCLRGEENDVANLIITASGGPFRTRPLSEMASVTPEEALRHPTWQMGKKITIDSSTLMNKAFEVIESHWLFNVAWDKINVVVHPQSIVHSLVEFQDGSVKAQLSPPDMGLPIQYALFHPRRVPNNFRATLNLVEIAALTFESLEIQRYPCFNIALDVAHAGGTYPAALSAADEVAVNMFLQGRLGFLDIPYLVEDVVSQHSPGSAHSLEEILNADTWARRRAVELAGN